jgi:hypothetical protein
MNKFPNFLVIGAGKSGTTSVYHALKQHPEIFMSGVKEPNFFALEGEKKITGYDKDDPHGFNFYPWAVTNMEDYQALFDEVDNQKMIGESSTMYQYMPKAPERIKQHIPNAKIIGIFRHPAERLYSRYLHLVRENRPPTENFEDCFEKGNLWWQKNDLIQEGFYYTHMKRYFDLFPREQIKIMFYEDLRSKPTEFMQELFDFLGVDNDFVPDLSVQYNVSGKIKNKWIDKIIGQQSLLRIGIEKVSPKLVNQARESILLQQIVTGLRKKNLERAPINPTTRTRLIQEIYKDEILQFQQLVNRDLSHWLAH